MLQNGTGGFHHGGIGAANEMIGVDDHAGSGVAERLFRHIVVAGGNQHHRHIRMLPLERRHESHDLVRLLLLAMDHDAVGSGRHIGVGPGQGVVHSLLEDQTLDPGNAHEVLRYLRLLYCGNLPAEPLDGVLLLDHIGAEEGIFFQPHLVLDDDGGHAQALQRADVEHQMLHQSAGIAVQNNGLGGHLHDLLDGLHPGREVHQFNVRLSFGCGITQAGDPHGVKAPGLSLRLGADRFHNAGREAVMGLHDPDIGLFPQQSAQCAQSPLGHNGGIQIRHSLRLISASAGPPPCGPCLL